MRGRINFYYSALRNVCLDAKSSLAQLEQKYLVALKQYAPIETDSAQTVDALVKGMDRAPTEKIDQSCILWAHVQKKLEGRIGKLRKLKVNLRKKLSCSH